MAKKLTGLSGENCFYLVCQNSLFVFTGEKETSTDKILKKLDETPMQREGPGGRIVTLEGDDYDVTEVKSQVMANVQEAVHNHEMKVNGLVGESLMFD